MQDDDAQCSLCYDHVYVVMKVAEVKFVTCGNVLVLPFSSFSQNDQFKLNNVHTENKYIFRFRHKFITYTKSRFDVHKGTIITAVYFSHSYRSNFFERQLMLLNVDLSVLTQTSGVCLFDMDLLTPRRTDKYMPQGTGLFLAGVNVLEFTANCLYSQVRVAVFFSS